MQRAGLSVVTLVAVLLMASPSDAARARHVTLPTCAPGHSHLLAADTQAETYEVSEAVSPEHAGVYGCVYGHHRTYYLGIPPEPPGSVGSPSGTAGTEKAVLAGPVVAYYKYEIRGGYTGEIRYTQLVVVRDLLSGHVLHEVPTGTPPKPEPGDIGYGPPATIVVKSDGSVSWINEIGEVTVGSRTVKPAEYEVHVVDKTGSRVLASGTNIDPSSLALAGSTLYWTQGGEPFSSTLN